MKTNRYIPKYEKTKRYIQKDKVEVLLKKHGYVCGYLIDDGPYGGYKILGTIIWIKERV